ncbi:hypothetical protein M0R19_05310 [Candidatus Pacearchaeota archaeon]|jgi:hypothetical protein|nr:hypothetical protein [Candidatus Pacearchaeota archaeon]
MSREGNKENEMLKEIICQAVDNWSNICLLITLVKKLENVSDSRFKDLTVDGIIKRVVELKK